jgi:hypothetical protein
MRAPEKSTPSAPAIEPGSISGIVSPGGGSGGSFGGSSGGHSGGGLWGGFGGGHFGSLGTSHFGGDFGHGLPGKNALAEPAYPSRIISAAVAANTRPKRQKEGIFNHFRIEKYLSS